MDQMQFTDRALKAMTDASELATQYQHTQVMPVHVAVALLDPPSDTTDKTPAGATSSAARNPDTSLFRQVVERAHGDVQSLDRSLKKMLVRLPSQDPPPEQMSISPSVKRMLQRANDLQKTQRDSYIAQDHIIAALAQDDNIKRALAEANIPNPKLLDAALQQIRGTKRMDSKTADAEGDSEYLKKFTQDMTALAKEGKIDPVIGRDEEVRRVIRVLMRRTKNNPVIIGEPGVGNDVRKLHPSQCTSGIRRVW